MEVPFTGLYTGLSACGGKHKHTSKTFKSHKRQLIDWGNRRPHPWCATSPMKVPMGTPDEGSDLFKRKPHGDGPVSENSRCKFGDVTQLGALTRTQGCCPELIGTHCPRARAMRCVGVLYINICIYYIYTYVYVYIYIYMYILGARVCV